MNPTLDNFTSFQSGSSGSLMVNSPLNPVLVAWCDTSVGTPPSVTYNSAAFTFPVSPAFNVTFNRYSPWVGYLVNPTQGTNTATFPNTVFTTIGVFSNVDQSTPFGNSATRTSGSGTIPSPDGVTLSTFQDNSLVLKSSFEGSTTLGVTFADGANEVGGPLNTSNITPVGSPRWSYKPTTTAGNYTVSTSWSTGAQWVAMQAIELLYKPATLGGANSFFFT